jgi:hypothetical protein
MIYQKLLEKVNLLKLKIGDQFSYIEKIISISKSIIFEILIVHLPFFFLLFDFFITNFS